MWKSLWYIFTLFLLCESSVNLSRVGTFALLAITSRVCSFMSIIRLLSIKSTASLILISNEGYLRLEKPRNCSNALRHDACSIRDTTYVTSCFAASLELNLAAILFIPNISCLLISMFIDLQRAVEACT